jgi:phospholipase C
MKGDNWMAGIVGAVMGNPDVWNSTAILITYDDCGCFYDEVRPPGTFGIRTPMVIVSPWAKTRYVDHKDASFDSILAFTEHVFRLPPLTKGDATAYDYARAFDFTAPPRPAIPLPQHRVPPSSVRYLAEHPPDPDDPT